MRVICKGEIVMLNKIKSCVNDEQGQGIVEYGFLLMLIALVVISALTLLGPMVANIFNNASYGIK